MAGQTEEFRRLITLVESLDEARAPQEPVTFGIMKSRDFEESLKRNMKVFPDLAEKLKKFLEVKLSDPMKARYGKHDSPFKPGTPLAGFMHCHLRDDAVLIYSLKNRNVNLLYICTHAEMEGKNTNKLAKRITALA